MRKVLMGSAMLLALAGCSEKLDFRNTEVSNGMFYGHGENEPFSGQITNVPYNIIPTAGLKVLIQMSTQASKDKTLHEFLFVSGMAALIGSNVSATVLCDVKVSKGYLDGAASCVTTQGRMKVADLNFAEGNLSGNVTLYSLHAAAGPVLSESHFVDGKLDGKLKVYDPGTKNPVNVFTLKAGMLEGPVEYFSPATGKLIKKGNFRQDTVDGIWEGFDPETGKKTFTSTYLNGKLVEEQTPQPVPEKLVEAVATPATQTTDQAASDEKCVMAWIDAFHKELGDDASISADQISEWEGWCGEGKHPQTTQG